MNDELDFNKRQYERMLDKIGRFESEKVQIDSLISDLEGLISALRNVPEDWRGQLERVWAILEDTYAVALDNGKTAFDEKDVAIINGAITELKELVKRGIGH